MGYPHILFLITAYREILISDGEMASGPEGSHAALLLLPPSEFLFSGTSKILNKKIKTIFHLVRTGAYLRALQKSELYQSIAPRGSTKVDNLQAKVKSWCDANTSEDDKLEALAVSAACVRLFMQANVTGPQVKDNILPTLPSNIEDLVLSGEDVSPSTRLGLSLMLARAILVDNFSFFPSSLEFYVLWWSARYASLHQLVFKTNVAELAEFSFETWRKICEILDSKKAPKAVKDHPTLTAQAYLEASQSHWTYYRTKLANEALDKAKKFTGVKLNATGIMGKRTMFQQESKVQLVVEIASKPRTLQADKKESLVWKEIVDRHIKKAGGSEGKTGMEESKPDSEVRKEEEKGEKDTSGLYPPVAPLNSDYLLNKPKLDKDSASGDTCAVDRAILLLQSVHKRKVTMLGDVIGNAESLEYVRTVVNILPKIPSGERSWSIMVASLYYRSMWEAGDREYSTRSLAQLENLSFLHEKNSEEDEIVASFRQSTAYISALPPIWELRAALADGYQKMNMLQSALKEFTKLESWPEVIRCSILLGRKAKAEELLQKEIKNHSPAEEGKYKNRAQKRMLARLYCFLGMIRNDPAIFAKAWEISGKSYPKAARLLAAYHYNRKEYKESIGHFRDALAVNPVHIDSWYKQGVAAFETEEWETAKNAFSRVVSLDRDNGQAWNNLAAVHLHLKNHKEALGALEEATKHKRRNWKIWENYLTTALHLKWIPQACRGLSKSIELRRREAINSEVIDLMTLETITQTLPIIKEKAMDKKVSTTTEERVKQLGLGPGSVFQLYYTCLQKCTDLVSHPALWKARAELSELVFDYESAVEFREHHLKGLQVEGWEEKGETAVDVLVAAISLVAAYLKTNDANHTTSARLLVDSLEGRISKSENLEDLVEVRKLSARLQDSIKSAVTTVTATVEENSEEQSTLPDYLADWA